MPPNVSFEVLRSGASHGCLPVQTAALKPFETIDKPATLLTSLAFSTCAQTLFGLDGRAGMTRYRLLPIRGWQILLAKDTAFLLLSVVLTLALDPAAGLAAALAGLATARKPAVREDRAQLRWRLRAGTDFGSALVQIIALIGAASAAHLISRLTLFPIGAVWIFSLWWGGRELEARRR